MSELSLEALNQLVSEVEKKGFRARFIDPLDSDPLSFKYLPGLGLDGVPSGEVPELLRKLSIVAPVRKWTDIQIVGPDLEPIKPVVNPSVALVDNVPLNDNPSVEDILASARKVPFVPGMPRWQGEEEDRFEKALRRASVAHGLPLERLRRAAYAAEIEDVVNIDEALAEVCESLVAND